jgi:cystathionine beta-lyase/cystathionine gamma-synthase
MEPRALGKIVREPQARRAWILAEGLRLLVERFRQMQESADALAESGHLRGANVVDMVRA